MKRTKEGGFAHITCSVWIDGIQIGDIRNMDPILNIPKILKQQQQKWNVKIKNKSCISSSSSSRNKNKNKNKNKNSPRSRRKKQRQKQKNLVNDEDLESISMMDHLSNLDINKCCICKQSGGGFIKCCHPSCHNRFHVLCAWFNGQYMTMSVDHNDNNNNNDNNDNDGNIHNGFLNRNVYCIQHTPMSVGGLDRNFEKFRLLRRQGLTQNDITAQIHRRERILNQMIDNYSSLNSIRDTYLPERCAVCFKDNDKNQLIVCKNCGITVHKICYGIDNNFDNGYIWYCDPCLTVPQYAKSVKLPNFDQDGIEESDHCTNTSSVNTRSNNTIMNGNGVTINNTMNNTMHNTRTASVELVDVDYSDHIDLVEPDIDAVQCVLCPRKGGALKLAENKYWVHLCCIKYIPSITFENNQIFGLSQVLKQQKKIKCKHKCYLCHNDEGYTIKCCRNKPVECDLYFHVLCGIFSGCFMSINNDKNTMNVFCRKHSPILKSTGGIHHPYEYMKLLKLRKSFDEIQCIFYLLQQRQFQNKKLIQQTIEEIKEKLPKSPLIPSTPSSQLIVANDEDINTNKKYSDKQEMDDDDQEMDDDNQEYARHLDYDTQDKYKMAIIEAYRKLNDDNNNNNNNDLSNNNQNHSDDVYIPPIDQLQNYANSATNAVNEIYNFYQRNQLKQMNSIKTNIGNIRNFKHFDDGEAVNQLISVSKYINNISSQIFNGNHDFDDKIKENLDLIKLKDDDENNEIASNRFKELIKKINDKYLTQQLKQSLDLESHTNGHDNNHDDNDHNNNNNNNHNIDYDLDKEIDADLANKIKICKLCGRERGRWSISVWIKHLNNKHIHECNHCNFKTTKAGYLNRHLLQHQ